MAGGIHGEGEHPKKDDRTFDIYEPDYRFSGYNIRFEFPRWS